MAETKDGTPNNKEQQKKSGFNFGCCDPERMAQMMKTFCCGKEGTMDCEQMMKKMCGADAKQSK